MRVPVDRAEGPEVAIHPAALAETGVEHKRKFWEERLQALFFY